MLLVSLVVLVALVTVMSGIGVCEHCGIGNGGIYSMISTVLGGRVAGTVGLLYVFGQASFRSCGRPKYKNPRRVQEAAGSLVGLLMRAL